MFLQKIFLAISLFVLGLSIGQAQKLYKWVDEQGKVTYQDQPPSEGTDYTEQNLSSPRNDADSEVNETMADAAAANPVVFFSVADCDSCDLVRNYLQRHQIPFSEKDASKEMEVRRELQERTERAEVPALLIGDEVIIGYNRLALDTGFGEAGFPLKGVEEQVVDESSAETTTGKPAEE